MTDNNIVDERERISRMEAIAFIAAELPDMVTLAASQPKLQELLRMADQEAREVLARFAADQTAAGKSPDAWAH